MGHPVHSLNFLRRYSSFSVLFSCLVEACVGVTGEYKLRYTVSKQKQPEEKSDLECVNVGVGQWDTDVTGLKTTSTSNLNG